MPFLLRETGPSRPPSPGPAPPIPPLDTLPSYEHSPMPHLNLGDEVSHAFEHPATVPPSPYEMPVPVPISGSHSPAPLEIVLANDDVVFRGISQDVEDALLSGHVILNLSEATNIREITLQLTGKVRIQLPEGTPHARQGHYSHVVYSHEWSFLEGERNHKHTIKAGQHIFPFQVQLPSSLPSSIRTYSGSASVLYKLRATAVRSAFSANYHAFRAFNVMRSFLPEAMEYNQTLEIENTWPGKIMYSFIVPHKAFSAGDDIPVLVKFQPVAKGVSVQSITTMIKEYTSVRWRGLQHQETRTVASAKHEIRNGRAVLVNSRDGTETPSHPNPPSAQAGGRSSSYMNMFGGHSRGSASTSANGGGHGDVIGHAISRLHAASSSVALAVGSSSTAPSASGSADGHDTQPIASSSRLSGDVTDSPITDPEVGDDEVDTSLYIRLPASTSPTSTIEPILSLYKIKFSVVISNMDGHTSELRCALPIHVMDPRLADEVRLATSATRNLLFGSENTEELQNMELPSYQAHVLDRIAVADVSQSTRTVSNPLSRTNSSANIAGTASPGNQSRPSTGYFNIRTTPGASAPGSPGPNAALDSAVDQELLLSLGAQPNAVSGPPSSSNTPPESRRESRAGSRVTSRAGSRAGSRASSPERGQYGHGGVDVHKLAGALHSNRSSLFHFPSSMKPFTPFSKSRNSHSHSASAGGSGNYTGHASSSTSGNHTPASHHTPGSHTPGTGTHSPGEPATTDTLSRVPDYVVASRGFLGGGVTPLSRDLPSYDQAQQHGVTTSSSAGNLVELAAGAGDAETATRPDVARRSTGDLVLMRSGTGTAPASSLRIGASTSGTQPVQ